MGEKLQKYLENKRIKEQGLPIMYVVKSDRTGVEMPVERQVIEIKKNTCIFTYANDKTVSGDTYILDKTCFPYEIVIPQNRTSASEDGYGSGQGDLWSWSYCCFLSYNDAIIHYHNEFTRIKNVYGKKESIEITKQRDLLIAFADWWYKNKYAYDITEQMIDDFLNKK